MRPHHLKVMEEYIEQERKSLAAKYRLVFLANDIGIDVLDDILRECKFFASIDPDLQGQVALHNLGKLILNKCGIWNDRNTGDILRNIRSLTEGGTHG